MNRGNKTVAEIRRTLFRCGLAALLLPSAALGIQKASRAKKPEADRPIWSKKGVAFWAGCSGDLRPCQAKKIPSPDGRNYVNVSYSTNPEDPRIEDAKVTVVAAGKKLGEVDLAGFVEDEVVWSPDSKAFFMNGNNNGYGDYHVAVHRIDDPKLGPGNVTQAVGRDMVRSFPPCKAKDPPDGCAELARNPDDYIGMAGVDWVDGSSRIVVMAEVTCSSSMGGIMCQVNGYEIDVPSGKIERRMEAKEFGRRWQHSMAWKFNIPDPPDYSDK
ncbi:MAG TPA: hypothetical protein VMH00_04975 [Candidatus Limnocylindrales bacterium]|nr:hypothetical protein [Candidatus Limnocylindrales bacterium]